MKKTVVLLIICLLFIGCKTAKSSFIISEDSQNSSETSLFILNEHAKHLPIFDNVIIKGGFDFTTTDQDLEGTMEIKIEKDKQILIQIRRFTLPIAKILITPDKVCYYTALNNTYFDSDFTVINRLLGRELNYNHLQNLLLGQILDSNINGEIISSTKDGVSELRILSNETPELTYFLEDKSALLKREELTTVNSNGKVTISYPDYQKSNNYIVPTAINILAKNEKNIQLNMQFNKVSFNEKMPFKYKVPTNYKRIVF